MYENKFLYLFFKTISHVTCFLLVYLSHNVWYEIDLKRYFNTNLFAIQVLTTMGPLVELIVVSHALTGQPQD